MMNTLEDLKSGKLLGSKSLKLSCGLKEFPIEILTLSETLEFLDLSDNELSVLPDSISELVHLKIIFFANNKFKEFPSILATFSSLRMIGFKSNQIEFVPENSFPLSLKWLVLTNNLIKKIPRSIGKCVLLQKCLLAGNLIEQLPIEMSNCLQLELLRVSTNKLELLPSWLFKLPNISWVAFGGNKGSTIVNNQTEIPLIKWNNFSVKELLGEGASGYISKAYWDKKQQDIAVKIFKGSVTSDGLPEDEMSISIAAGKHDSLIPVLGKIIEHPEKKMGLVMELISAEFTDLGSPPSLETCTRDTFNYKNKFKGEELLLIVKSIASVCFHLHSKGINHGDLYAHNILVNNVGECILGDFGAASFYDPNSELAPFIERVEVRAFGCLLEDLMGLLIPNDFTNENLLVWKNLINKCNHFEVESRPSFKSILSSLEHINV